MLILFSFSFFSVVFAYRGNDTFGDSVLPVVARNWTCKGNEPELRKCGFFYGNSAGCNTNTRPAGVRCGPGSKHNYE